MSWPSFSILISAVFAAIHAYYKANYDVVKKEMKLQRVRTPGSSALPDYDSAEADSNDEINSVGSEQ